MMNEYVRSVMTTNVITLTPHNTLGEVREILTRDHIHHIPIVEGHKLVGMISSWDIFKLGKSIEEYENMPISEVMVTKIATMESDQHLGAAAEVLMAHRFNAVPIVDENRSLIGIITTYDILKYEYLKEYPENLEKFIPENM
jgi:CBS domain-containing protein